MKVKTQNRNQQTKELLQLEFLILFLLTFFFLQSQAQTPEQSAIANVMVHGRGCSSESTRASLSPDAKSLSLLFDEYKVEIGEGSSTWPAPKAVVNCHVSMDILTPPNWQFAFEAIDYRGYVQLPSSASAFHRLTYVNSQQLISSLREATFLGPINEDYYQHFQQRQERLVWSPCGARSQKLQFISQIGVQFYPRSTDRSLAQISIDSSDMNIDQKLSVVWRTCEPLPERNSPFPRDPRPPRYGRF